MAYRLHPEEWHACSSSQQIYAAKFSFLQKLARDVTGSDVEVWENFAKDTNEFDHETWGWVTKYDLYAKKQAHASVEQKNYCDKLINAAKRKPHTDKRFKKDQDMDMYRILWSDLQGTQHDNRTTSSYKLGATVKDEDKGEVLDTLAKWHGGKAKNAKEEEVDAPRTPTPKVVKGTLQEQREKKIHADVQAGSEAVANMRAAQTPLSGEIIDSISSCTEHLKTAYKNMCMHRLEAGSDEAHNAAWLAAVPTLRSLKIALDIAYLRLGKTKMYSSPWDNVLVT